MTLSLHPLAWTNLDRRLLYRAILVLTDPRLTPYRAKVARHALLVDLELYDDPRQGLGFWLSQQEQKLAEQLGEQLQATTGPQSDYPASLKLPISTAIALKSILESNELLIAG